MAPHHDTRVKRNLVDPLKVAAVQTAALGTTTVTALSAAVQPAITGGESPTEAEFNALRLEVVDLRARVAELTTAMASVTTHNGLLRTNLNALNTAIDAL